MISTVSLILVIVFKLENASAFNSDCSDLDLLDTCSYICSQGKIRFEFVYSIW